MKEDYLCNHIYSCAWCNCDIVDNSHHSECVFSCKSYIPFEILYDFYVEDHHLGLP